MKKLFACFFILSLFWSGIAVCQSLEKPQLKPVDNINSEILSELINLKRSWTKDGLDRNKYSDNYWIVKVNGKYGVYNDHTKTFFANAIYDSITIVGNVLVNKKWKNLLYGDRISDSIPNDYPQGVVFFKGNKQGLKDLSGKTIVGANYDEVKLTSQNCYLLRKKDKWGFASAVYMKKLVKPEYDYIVASTNFNSYTVLKAYKNKVLKVYHTNGKKVLLLKKGEKSSIKQYVESSFEQFSTFQNINKFIKNGNYGVEDSLGKTIIPAIYSSIEPTDKDIFVVSKDSLFGVIDYKNKQIIPLKYKKIYACSTSNLQRFYIAEDPVTGLTGILNNKGATIYPFITKTNLYFSTYYLYRTAGTSAYIVVNEAKNDYDKNYSLLKFNNGTVTTILQNCEEIYFFDTLKNFENILSYTNKKNITGFYNINTDAHLKPEYAYFSNGKDNKKILVKTVAGDNQLIDSTFNIIKVPFPISGNYIHGVLLLKTPNGMRVMNENGIISKFTYPVINFNYIDERTEERTNDEGKNYLHSFFKYYNSANLKKPGIINTNGEVIIPADKYDEVSLSIMPAFFENVSQIKKVIIDKYFNKTFICTTQNSKKNIKVLFKDNRTIASYTIPQGWSYSCNDITNNEQLIIKSKDSVRLYNLITKKDDLITRSRNFTEDPDGGFTNILPVTGSKNPYKKQLIKYSKTGHFISSIINTDDVFATGYYKNNGVYITTQNSKYGIVNADDVITSPFINDTLYTYNHREYFAKRNGKFGVINSSGKTLVSFSYDSIIPQKTHTGYMSEYDAKSIYLVKNKTGYGIINTELKQILEPVYDTITLTQQTLIAKKGNNFTVFDLDGKALFSKECDLLINNDNSFIYNFYSGGNQGLINGSGEVLIEPIYKKAVFLSNKHIIVTIKNKLYVTNLSGKIMLPFEIKEIKTEYSENHYYDIREKFYTITNVDNKVGLYDADLKQVLPFEYSKIDNIENLHYVFVRKGNLRGIVDVNGKIIVPLINGDIDYEEEGEYFSIHSKQVDYKIAPNGIILEEQINN